MSEYTITPLKEPIKMFFDVDNPNDVVIPIDFKVPIKMMYSSQYRQLYFSSEEQVTANFSSQIDIYSNGEANLGLLYLRQIETYKFDELILNLNIGLSQDYLSLYEWGDRLISNDFTFYVQQSKGVKIGYALNFNLQRDRIGNRDIIRLFLVGDEIVFTSQENEA